MVEVSKHLFEQTCGHMDHAYMIHPWGNGCWSTLPLTFKESFVGSAKFYSLVYLVQIIMRGKKMARKSEWVKMGEYYLRSTTLGAFVAVSMVTVNCLISPVLGNKINYYTYIFVPGTLSGLFIFLEPPSRRGLVINMFSNLFIDYWLRSFEKAGHLNLSTSKKTLLFMTGSALLFYLMRLEGDKPSRTPLLWLFTPDKVRRKSDESKNVCPHEGSCMQYILKGAATYFGIGSALTLSRIVLPKLTSPMKALASVQGKHFKMGLFFGSYIGIYRAVICYLCRKKGFDSAAYALPAGYLAGLSFLFNPNLTFAIASTTAAFKLFSTILYEKKLLPSNVPLPELLYCICQGTLFHGRFMHPDVTPAYTFKLMKDVSNGRTNQLYENMLKAISLNS